MFSVNNIFYSNDNKKWVRRLSAVALPIQPIINNNEFANSTTTATNTTSTTEVKVT